MKFTKFNTMTAAVLAGSLSVSCLTSCVESQYDLNKEIDTNVSIDGNISAPLGDSEKIMIGSLLQLDGNSILQQDAEGNWSLSLAGDPISEKIEVPAINMNAGELFSNADFYIKPIDMRNRIEASIPDAGEHLGELESYPLAGLKPVVIDDLLDGSNSYGQLSLDEDVSELASTVSEIGSISLDAPMKTRIALRSGNSSGIVTIKQGLTLTFPEFISVSCPSGMFSVVDSHILVLSSDTRVETGSPAEIEFNIDRIDLAALKEATAGTQGYVAEGDSRYIRIDQTVAIDGLIVTATPADFGATLGDVPETANCDIAVSADAFDVTGATLVLDPEIDIPDQSIVLDDMPEFFQGDNVNLDVYNPVIKISAVNSSPVAVAFSASLTGYDKDGNPTMDAPIVIGGPGQEAAVIRSLPGGAACHTTLYISRRPLDLGTDIPSDEYVQNIVIDNLGDIIARIPDSISISDIDLAPYREDGGE